MLNQSGHSRSATGLLEERVRCSSLFNQVLEWSINGVVLNLQINLRFSGPLNRTALERALGALSAEHEILRSYCLREDDSFYRRTLPWQPVELSPTAASMTEAARGAMLLTEPPFPVHQGLRWRLALYRLNECDHLLVVVIDHMVCDGFAAGLLVEELRAAYMAASTNGPLSAPICISFTHFETEQLPAILAQLGSRQLNYWQSQLKDFNARPALPPPRRAYTCAMHRFSIAKHKLAGSAFAAEAHTASTTLLTAYAIALTQLGALPDLVIHVVAANRRHPAHRRVLGCLANAVPLRLQVTHDVPIRDFLRHVARAHAGAYLNQEIPFLDVCAAVSSNGIHQASLSEYVFNFVQEPAPLDEIWPGKLRVQSMGRFPNESNRLRLAARVCLTVIELPDQFLALLFHDPESVSATQAQAFERTFDACITAMESQSELPLSSVLSHDVSADAA